MADTWSMLIFFRRLRLFQKAVKIKPNNVLLFMEVTENCEAPLIHVDILNKLFNNRIKSAISAAFWEKRSLFFKA